MGGFWVFCGVIDGTPKSAELGIGAFASAALFE
jgi:hypothetical protein